MESSGERYRGERDLKRELSPRVSGSERREHCLTVGGQEVSVAEGPSRRGGMDQRAATWDCSDKCWGLWREGKSMELEQSHVFAPRQ